MLTVHPLYGQIPSPCISREDISQDMNFETLLDRLKNHNEELFEKPSKWEIYFFIDKFLTSKENAREILKASQEGFYKSKNSNNYKIQEDPRKISSHISDFTNKIICLEKAYSNSIFIIRSSSKDRLIIEKTNFLREAFEELMKEENNNYTKVVNDIYRMSSVWLG